MIAALPAEAWQIFPVLQRAATRVGIMLHYMVPLN
jgi:hypothetical protein